MVRGMDIRMASLGHPSTHMGSLSIYPSIHNYLPTYLPAENSTCLLPYPYETTSLLKGVIGQGPVQEIKANEVGP